jgi:hypothetical protein
MESTAHCGVEMDAGRLSGYPGVMSSESFGASVMGAFERASAAVREELGQGAEDAIVAATIESSKRMLAMVEAAYLVAAADGVLSDAETKSIATGMQRVGGDLASYEQVVTMLDIAADRFKAEGLQARASAVAEVIQDAELREATFLIAAAASWLDRGIGEKQGLALQAVSKAFGIPMNEMHELLAKAHAK